MTALSLLSFFLLVGFSRQHYSSALSPPRWGHRSHWNPLVSTVNFLKQVSIEDCGGFGVVTDNNFYSAPAGWYPDPLGLPQLRWWDSTQWTHQVAEARQPMVMQETTFKWAEDDEQDV